MTLYCKTSRVIFTEGKYLNQFGMDITRFIHKDSLILEEVDKSPEEILELEKLRSRVEYEILDLKAKLDLITAQIKAAEAKLTPLEVV